MRRCIDRALLFLILLAGGCGKPPVPPALDLPVFFTCDTRGRLEPCGCFAGQFGGLTRLKTVLDADSPANALRLDVGDAIGGQEDYDWIEYGYVLRAFAAMHYDALNIGGREARFTAAQLRGLLERSRQGLDTRIGEGGLKLSGGERQRLAIARALLRKPDLLIFDEATSSLDTETEKEITRTIDGIIRTRPSFVTLLIAHRLSTVAGADRIVVLKKGRVVEQGSHFDLLRKRGLYHTLWKQQGLERDEEPRKVAVQGG